MFLLWFLKNGYQAASPKDQVLIQKVLEASPEFYVGKRLNIYPFINGKPGKTEKRIKIEKTLSPESPSKTTRHAVKKVTG